MPSFAGNSWISANKAQLECQLNTSSGSVRNVVMGIQRFPEINTDFFQLI